MTSWSDAMGKMNWPDAVGILGVVISVYYYARVQWEREYAKKMSYSMGNLFGSLMIMYSLVYSWNVASVISNMAWGLISLYGVYRCLKYSWLEKKAAAQRRCDLKG